VTFTHRLLRAGLAIRADFLGWLVRSKGFIDAVVAHSEGVSYPAITPTTLASLPVWLPSLAEQHAIAAFLDRETAKTDALIAKKERQIELLREKRKALINHVVTQGIEPTVEMKDLGLQWLGRVPTHWELKRLGYISQGGLVNGLFKTKDHFGRGVRLVNVFDVYRNDFVINCDTLGRVEVTPQELKAYVVRPGDIFFVRSSLKLEGVGVSVCAKDVPEPMVFECHLVRVRPRVTQIDPQFLVNYLNAPLTRQRLVALAETTTMTTISQPKSLCVKQFVGVNGLSQRRHPRKQRS